jgi:hypothetical protein
MIEIESGYAIPSSRRADRNLITPSLKKLMGRYADAYQAVYGFRPEIKWNNPWFTVVGLDYRVDRNRLLEMARQLEYRTGQTP